MCKYMSNKYNPILANFPLLESLFRNLYWRIKPVYTVINYLLEKKSKLIHNPVSFYKPKDISYQFLNSIHSNIFSCDDSILVHSSLQRLKEVGVDASIFANELISSQSRKGNICLPTFPLFRNEPKRFNRFDDIPLDPNLFKFDLSSTRVSTGLLGKTILDYKNHKRSKIPINNLSALGSCSENLFNKEINYHLSPYPCGKYSAWQEIYKLNFTIVFLDVNPTHTCTLIHNIEDSNPELWPVSNWYRSREYSIRDKESCFVLKTLQRKPKWSLSYCENILFRDLIQNNIVQSHNVCGINIYIMKASEFINYVKNHRKENYPYYLTCLSRTC